MSHPLIAPNGKATKCPHCSGAMESVTPRGLAPFKRCTSCGRDDRASTSPLTAPSVAPKCTVEGCPGVVIAGRCDCCEKRQAWEDTHRPKRNCEICGGSLTGIRSQKRCKACAVVHNRVNVAKNKAER